MENKETTAGRPSWSVMTVNQWQDLFTLDARRLRGDALSASERGRLAFYNDCIAIEYKARNKML